MYVLNNNVTYFDSFRFEYIPKEIKKFINKSTFVTNIFRIQAYDSIMCGYFCIGFISFNPPGKTLTYFTNLFSPTNLKKKWGYNFKLFYHWYLKVVEYDSHETPDIYPNLKVLLNDQQQFRLKKNQWN